MASTMRFAPKMPIVVILGSTGVGKSKLAMELAKYFNTEVVGADAMQMYRGLDIVTNKVTEEERADVTHHMIDVLPAHARCTVTDYRDMALPIVRRLLDEGKAAVVAGGTNYYVESLLWDFTLQDIPHAQAVAASEGVEDDLSGDQEWDSLSSDELHALLTRVDPDTALRLHPNDVRKVRRALEVRKVSGRRLSDLHREQHAQNGASSGLSGALRFPDAAVFWLKSQQAVLDKRLDDRVDDMVKLGLVQELQDFHDSVTRRGAGNGDSTADTSESATDYHHGILQSIGFKEFDEYLRLSPDDRAGEAGRAALDKGIEAMKAATRRYAKKQTTWVQNRFLRRPEGTVPRVYELDSSEPEHWKERVLRPAIDAVVAVSKGEEPELPALPLLGERAAVVSRRCDACDGKLFVTEDQWQAHISSRRHRKRVAGARRRQEGEEEREGKHGRQATPPDTGD